MAGQLRAPARMTAIVEMPTEAFIVTAAPPDMVSQKNVEAVTGIPPHVYLEEIRSPRFPLPVIKLGKLRLVKRVDLLAYLDSLASGPGLTREDDARTDDEELDDLLAEVGLERCRPAGRRDKVLKLPPSNSAPRGRLLSK